MSRYLYSDNNVLITPDYIPLGVKLIQIVPSEAFSWCPDFGKQEMSRETSLITINSCGNR